MLMQQPTVLDTFLLTCLDGDVFVIYSAGILHMGPHGVRKAALAQMWLAPIYETLHGSGRVAQPAA